MLTECHFQKHTMPSAPVDAKYRDVPLTAGQNYGDKKKTELVGNVQEVTDFYHNITEANKESWHTSHSQLHLP